MPKETSPVVTLRFYCGACGKVTSKAKLESNGPIAKGVTHDVTAVCLDNSDCRKWAEEQGRRRTQGGKLLPFAEPWEPEL